MNLSYLEIAYANSNFYSNACVCMYSSGSRKTCKVTRQPWFNTRGRDRSPISNAIINVARKMTVPVTVLHVTRMGSFRSDGHVGTWSDNPSVPDCSHWCLPGVPDMWNEILFSYLMPSNLVSSNEQ